MKFIIFVFMVSLVFTFAIGVNSRAIAQEEIIFGFEEETTKWEIPYWAKEQKDLVGQSLEISSDMASKGEKSLKLMCDFPGGTIWTAAIIDYTQDLDLTGYKTISADVFQPKEARTNLLQARIILTVGTWVIIESKTVKPLKRGKWTTVEVPLDVSGLDEKLNWKVKLPENSLSANLDRIRKIAVRVEYNVNESQSGPRYKGPIYIDNIVIK